MAEKKEHLGVELFLRMSDPAEGGEESAEMERARRHVAGCAACRLRLSQYRAGQKGLEALRTRTSMEYPRRAECPEAGQWAELAAGLVEEKEAGELVKHAAWCGHCGPLLRVATENLWQEYGEEELKQIARLPSSTREGRRRLAWRMKEAAGGTKRGKAGARRWMWALVSATAVAAAAVLSVEVTRTRPASAGKLLAEAYSANRTLEMRIAGAAYAPMNTVRGRANATALPLLRAEVMIGKELEKEPTSAEWMALRGRAELLEGKYSDAQTTLEEALRLAPNTPSALVDLATAEYELAEQEGRDEEYMSAVAHLTQALELRHDDDDALFNRALVYERIGSAPLAIEDWEAYLRVDPSSAWANKVAREHLDALKKKVGPAPKSALPPTDAEEASAWLEQQLQKPPPRGTLNSSDEVLLNAAVTRWLPAYFSPKTETSAASPASERMALGRLGRVLASAHGDEWLADVLREAGVEQGKPPARELARGMQDLGQATAAANTGQLRVAEELAQRAERSLRAAGDPAAALRAEFELAYAYQLEVGNAERCRTTAEAALKELGTRQYPWLKGQLLLELGSGDVRTRRVGLAMQAMRESMEVARDAGYASLYLRATFARASVATASGDYRQAWRLDREGLNRYWNGEYPARQLYNLYADMGFAAEAAGNWKVAEALASEGVDAATRIQDRRWEAMSRFRLATVANLAGDRATAQREFERAGQVFASMPPDPAVRGEEAYMQVLLADLEVQTGDATSALKRLKKAEPLVRQAQNDDLTSRFYRGLGEAYLAERDVAEAEQSLLQAVAIAERGLHSLRNGAERVSWEETNGDVYRSLVRAELTGRGDAEAALAIWEWYRAGPVRAQRNERDAMTSLLSAEDESAGSEKAGRPRDFAAAAEQWLRSQSQGDEDKTIVSYAEFPRGIEIWTIRGGASWGTWVPVSQDELEKVARRFEEECSDSKSNVALLRADGRRLYDWLVAPVSAELAPGRELVLETDGAISRLPLEALVAPNGQYLENQFAMAYSPGLGYGETLRPETALGAGDRMLAIGAPALTEEWQSILAPLPGADAEARRVGSEFHSAVVLTGSQATLPAVMREMPEAQIFHFAGHALAQENRTGLVLTARKDSAEEEAEGAAVLESADLGPRELRECRLAVLSACSTASGEGKELVNPESLVGAFLLAGVPDVVASRWNVNSDATTRLMEVFYRRLLSGETVAEALQQASERIRRDPETSRPYFWAAFSAYGR